MIRFALENDKSAIFDLYCKALNSNNLAYVQAIFDSNYNPINCLVNEVNGHVVAAIQLRYMPIVLNQKKVMSCFIIWQLRDSSKNKQYLAELLQNALEQQNHKVLLTYMKESEDNQYQKLGFESLYHRKMYSISRNNIESNSFVGVSRDFDIITIKNVYDKFVSNFNGYQHRSYEYYQNLIPYLQAKKYSLAVYYDEDKQAQGYMIYTVEYNRIVIQELIYLNGLALTRLLCYGLRNRNNIEVHTSQYENLSKLYPSLKAKEVSNLVVRINDFDLFNKLFNLQAKSCQEALLAQGKPLYLNELSL